MKLIIATPIYPPEIGGPATYTKELCERIAHKHNITVITYTNSAEAFPGTHLIPVGKGRPLPIRLVLFFIKLLRIARDYNVIYVQNAMAAGLPVALVSMLTGVPFVLKFVGDEAWERATQHKFTTKRLEEFLACPEGPLRIRLMMWIQGLVLRRATVVTTPSAYLLQEVIKAYGIKPQRGVVNYNAADKTEELPFPVTRIHHQIATTARLVKWKGIEGIIRAVALLKEKFPDIKLVVAGDGPEKEHLERIARDLGVADHVNFLGNISRAETWRLRKQSEVYVLNSTYEGLPHTILTSFAAEIPTVATDIPGTNEALYHEKTGLLVKPGDDQGLAHAIERLLNDPKLGTELAQNGTKLLKEKFSWDAHLRTLEEILRSVVA